MPRAASEGAARQRTGSAAIRGRLRLAGDLPVRRLGHRDHAGEWRLWSDKGSGIAPPISPSEGEEGYPAQRLGIPARTRDDASLRTCTTSKVHRQHTLLEERPHQDPLGARQIRQFSINPNSAKLQS